MDEHRFDRMSRLLARGATRRGVLAALAGVAAAALTGTPVAGRRPKRWRRRDRPRVRADAVLDACRPLCAVLPPRLRERCLAAVAAAPVACTCPSFCRRLHPGRPLRQLACLREAAQDPGGSLCLACGADPDRVCAQDGGGHICCGAAEACAGGQCMVGCPIGSVELDNGSCAVPCRDIVQCRDLGLDCHCIPARNAGAGVAVCGKLPGSDICRSANCPPGQGCTLSRVPTCFSLCPPPA